MAGEADGEPLAVRRERLRSELEEQLGSLATV